MQNASTSVVQQWCCCLETHADGVLHFHMSILLDKATRWKRVRDYLQTEYGIAVNFSGHGGYFSAYNYVVKEDTEAIHSEGHPKKVKEPKTSAASKAKVSRKKCKARKLSKMEVADIIIKHKLENRLELLRYATELRNSGSTDLYRFCIEKSSKALVDFIGTVWDAENAEKVIERRKSSRMEILMSAQGSSCVCEGEWIQCALELLDKSRIEREEFSTAIKELLEKGRGKGRNILLTGPANCGKTFLLHPLTKIFDAFCNPATGSFAWIGVEEREIIFLNDFRWDKSVIPWADMLLLLEGQLVHFPAPKTHYSKDITLEKDTPIFCTSKGPFVFGKNSIIDDRETEMMQVRWHHFQFRFQLKLSECKDVPSCPKCFASFIL